MQKRIAHITDTHIDDKTALDRRINPRDNLNAVLENIAALGADEIVFTGDIGETTSYSWLFEKLETYSPNFKLTLGNHDDFTEAIKHFKIASAGEGELYYAAEDEFYKYIYMDSSSAEISETQLAWLENEVNTLKKIIVFVHHPILGFETGMDNIYPLHNRDKVVELLQQAKNPVNVFCGHYHMPDKRTRGKVTQYITPAVSFQVKKFSPKIEIRVKGFGYRIINLTETGIKTTLITNNYDNFSVPAF